MAVLANRVTVGTTATRVDTASDVNYDQTVLLYGCLTADTWLGGPGVTSTTGFKVTSGLMIEWALTGNDALYAVAASSVECQVLQRNGEVTLT